ncbi:MBL fold metallo-hydrolase [Microvirga zambiensis]|uniref:MBL fold metallo-hydrolase n=1 Tax=Microvirga zambiensis TaxID=1402137 RepID=UPI00191F4D79|nr:MBL fold metallo-hydrolase [Microvirga zambiensis]
MKFVNRSKASRTGGTSLHAVAAMIIGLSLLGRPVAAIAQETVSPRVQDTGMVVTLLGTGTPLLSARRFGFSNIVQAGPLTLMFDAGRGSAIRLGQLGIPVGRIDALFLTHFHSDHVVGLPDIFMTGYLGLKSLGGRQTPLQVYGPTGTKPLIDGIRQAFSADAKIRHNDEKLSFDAMPIVAHEFEVGVVFEQSGVKVTAFEVDHGEHIKPSIGYQVDYGGNAVVFSGDTRHSENLISKSQNADLIIHEMAAAPSETNGNPVYQKILGHHTSPEEAGDVFARVKPAMAVYSHAGRLAGPTGVPSWGEIIKRTRKNYSGPLIIGEDLMQFFISENTVAIAVGGAD